MKTNIKRIDINVILAPIFFFLSLVSIAFSSTFIVDVSSELIREMLYNEMAGGKNEFSSVFLENANIEENGDQTWIEYANGIESKANLSFSISKVYEPDTSNFQIQNETESINETRFTILDTNSYSKNPLYSTSHIECIFPSSGWSNISYDNAIFISNVFANKLAASRGLSSVNTLVGSTIDMQTPNHSSEVFTISGLIDMRKEASINNGGSFFYNLFDNEVFYVSRETASKYSTSTLLCTFNTKDRKLIFEYYSQIIALESKGYHLASFSSQKVDDLLFACASLYSSNIRFLFGSLLIMSGLVFIIAYLIFVNKISNTFHNKKLLNFPLSLVFTIFASIIIFFFSEIFLKYVNIYWANYEIPPLHSCSMNSLVVSFFALLLIGTKIAKKNEAKNFAVSLNGICGYHYTIEI